MKNTLYFLLLIFLGVQYSYAQKGHPFGQLLNSEKNLEIYEKDPEANAVVLYERGDNYFEAVRNRINLIQKYHVKIKILNHSGFDEGTISIKYLSSEKIENLKAIIHNDHIQTIVSESQIFTTELNTFTNQTKFTFPTLKIGSIIEYEYTLRSPYIYRLNGWGFQSNIPKIHSEFNAKIPGSYVYNRTLLGSLSLETNSAVINKNCFKSTFLKWDCEELKYVMKNIPAFNADSNYMLSPSNYLSRIEFELSEIVYTNGKRENISSTWKEIDSNYKNGENIGMQLTKKKFFARKVPDELFDSKDLLVRAKKIYAFIQNHFIWDQTYGSYNYSNVKEAYRLKRGSVSEINMSLINLLNAAGIKADLMLLSTRKNGLPKKTHPVVYDFNYFIVKIKIEGKDYLLDASDKFIPFGMLPFKCLNNYGRVMDFKKDSYWFDIIPAIKNKKMIRGKLQFNIAENKVFGMFDELNTGYDAIFKRKELEEKSEDNYIEALENNISDDLSIISYQLLEKRNNEKTVTERVKFEIENLVSNNVIYFDPFLIKFFTENPFILEKRNYPIDFGFNKNYNYSMSIEVPEGFIVGQLPEKVTRMLPDNMGVLKFESTLTNNNIMVYFNLTLNRAHYLSEDYNMLKDLFAEAITIQNNSIIVLKKN